jgi:hypothetical protein
MNIILNETEIALKSIDTGYIDNKKPTNTIRLLIKYYHSKGMIKEQIRSQIEDFMKKNYDEFNSSNWQNTLDRMIRTYTKNDNNSKLIDIDNVNITINELNKIKELDNLKLEKIAFVLLVYAKVLNKINEKNNNWVNKSTNVIFPDTLLKDTGKERKLLINKLKELEYIEYSKKVDKISFKVMYLDENSDIRITINDFRDFVLEYLKWKGDDIGYCENCGKPIKITNNKVKNCKECAKEIKSKQDRIADKKYKEKKRRENRKCL